jgi:hypothetical protein
MKKLILATITLVTTSSVFAQGTVSFVNRSAGGTTHVYYTPAIRTQIQGNGAIDFPAGTTDYSGGILIGTTGGMTASTTYAQLLGAPGSGTAESSLLPGLPVTTFRTGAAAGNIALVTATFANIPQDAPVGTFEMVAWDNSSGLYPTWAQASVAWLNNIIVAGRSAPFVLQNIGGTTFNPPNINPAVGSFNIHLIVPEPTTVALAGLGAAALLIFRRRK